MATKQSYLNKAKKDKFLLVFDLPPILKGVSDPYLRNNKSVSIDSVQFSIFGSMVPEITVKAVETRYAGSTLYVPSYSKDSYPPVNVKFAVDSEYRNYWTIYQWLNLIHDDKKGVFNGKGFPASDCSYETDITIYGLDEFKKKKIKFIYKKAFPTTLDAIEYDQKGTEGEDIISGFTFIFSQLHTEIVEES